MKYRFWEVRQRIGGRMENTWTTEVTDDATGETFTQPTIFSSPQEAQQALDDHYAALTAAGMDNDDEFGIVTVEVEDGAPA